MMEQPQVWYLLLLLGILLAGGAWRLFRPTLHNGISALAWLAIIGVIMVIYVLRDELSDIPQRLQTEFRGIDGTEQHEGMRYPRDERGQVIVATRIAGISIPMLLDTGASSVMLQKTDAARMGILPAQEEFRYRVQTASGTELMARVRLPSMEIGTMLIRDIAALISPKDTGISLLGMSALQHFDVRFAGQYVHVNPK